MAKYTVATDQLGQTAAGQLGQHVAPEEAAQYQVLLHLRPFEFFYVLRFVHLHTQKQMREMK